MLKIEDGEVILMDLGSMNGTFVDGEKIQWLQLKSGVKVSIGGAILKYRRT